MASIAKLLRSTTVRIVITLLIFLLMALTISMYIFNSLESSREGIRDFYRLQVDLMAAKAQTVSYSRRGEEELQRILAASVNTELQIAYAYIERAGRVVIHTFDGTFPEQVLDQERALSQQVSDATVTIGETELIDFARLYSISSRAAVHIGVRTSVIEGRLFSTAILPGFLLAVSAVLASLAALYFVWSGSRSGSDSPPRPRSSTRSSVEEARWRELFMDLPAISALYHAETGEIRDVNRSFLELSGKKYRSVQGAAIGSFLVGSDDESVPLNMIDDANPDNTVYFKRGRRSPVPLYAEAQELYIGDELFQLINAFDISDMLRNQQSLRTQRNEQSNRATHDALTGLLNRLGIESHAQAELNRAERGEEMTVLLADIDHFKKINDTYGHKIGDMVLKRVAEVINSTKRPYDWAGRWGGEEFLILLPGTGIDNAVNAAERIRAAIATTPMHVARGTDESISISIGVASTAAHSANTVKLDGIVNVADKALYAAKEQGRNRVMAVVNGTVVGSDEL